MILYPIAQDGVFWTLQGEGHLTGTPMAFIRLAGCSVGCTDCDTDYGVKRRVPLDDLVAEVQRVIPASFTWPWVWLTGGEPTDHDLTPLIRALRSKGMRVALATSGVRELPAGFADWLSVSPHSVTAKLRYGHELKVIPGLNGLTWEQIEQDIWHWRSFAWRFVQPLWYHTTCGPEWDGAASRESLDACKAFVLTHPGWQLATQAHKAWGVR